MSLTSDLDVATAVTAHPDAGDRLIAGVSEREGLPRYLSSGGYAPGDAEPLLESVDQAGLRGRGGAAFPTSRKLRAVRSAGKAPVVVANGEEGEPASVKDRWLLRHRPHLVLDGLRLAALMVGSEDVHVYVSDPASQSSVQQALDELAGAGVWGVEVTVTQVEPTYVAGEETAVVRALNGGPALPADKPPRPFESGVEGRPTLVSNVETLANLPLIQRLGAAGYRAAGTATSPGTFLLTLTGCRATGLYEVPFGVTPRAVLSWLGVDPGEVRALLMGGYFSGVLGPRGLDIPLDYDSLKAAGSGLGCGAIGIVSQDTCPVAVSAAVMSFFARENAAQCGSCFNGTASMSTVLDALVNHEAKSEEVERLRYWSTFLPGRGACGTLDGASNVAASLLREFPDAVSAHLDGGCETCGAGVRVPDPPYAAGLP